VRPPGSRYSRPPIVEAVIEVRLADQITTEELARANSALSEHYPAEQSQREAQFRIEVEGLGRPRPELVAEIEFFQRASQNQREVAVVKPSALAVADRAPYAGWDQFAKRFQRDWLVWTKAIGHRAIQRVGMRYINRIDVPWPDGAPALRQEDYIKTYFQAPEDAFGLTLSFEARAVFRAPKIDGQFLLRTARLPVGSVPGHLSILLDIDLSRDTNLPAETAELTALLNAMRHEKNRIFESCVTDRARELFR
jgi:uncharacterized protein (TIGR04255 family)